jgi:hypothetical protein
VHDTNLKKASLESWKIKTMAQFFFMLCQGRKNMKIDETVVVKIDLEIEEVKKLIVDLERISMAEKHQDFDLLGSFYKQLKGILKNYE